MVPPEEIEKAQPATLPADFSEWDSGEAPAVQPARHATARVVVSPVAGRPHNAGSSRPAAAYEDVEKLFQPRKSDGVKVAVEKQKAEREDNGKGRRKGMLTFAAIGSVAVLLILGALGYTRLRPGQVIPKPPVVAGTNEFTSGHDGCGASGHRAGPYAALTVGCDEQSTQRAFADSD
jgi:hypothetical protein